MLCLLLLLALLSTVARAPPPSGDISLALQQPGAGQLDVRLVTVYAGHPRHAMQLQLVIGTPPGDFVQPMSITGTNDLHGQYAALVLPASDPLAWPLLHTPPAPSGALAPRVSLYARGHTFALAANVSTARRGVILLAPGSSVWLHWRYATLRTHELVLSNKAAPRRSSGSTTSVVLACADWDARGRCVLQRGLTVNGTTYPIVLDFERSSSILPSQLYAAALRRHMIYWTPGASRLALASARLVSDGHSTGLLGGSATPEFVASAVPLALDQEVVVLGTRTMQRLFSTMTYDSALNVWHAVTLPTGANDWGVYLILALLTGMQTFGVLVRFYVSALNLRLRAALRAPLGYKSVLDTRLSVYLCGGAFIGLLGAWLGQAHASADPAEWSHKVALGSAILASIQIALQGVVLFVVAWPPARLLKWLESGDSMTTTELMERLTPSPPPGEEAAQRVLTAKREFKAACDLALAGLHGTSLVFALIATITPAASTVPGGQVILSAIVLCFLLGTLGYHVLALLAVLVALPRLGWTGWRRPALCVVWLTQLAILVCVCVGAHLWVLQPTALVLNELHSEATLWMDGGIAVGGVMMTVACFVLAESLSALKDMPTNL